MREWEQSMPNLIRLMFVFLAVFHHNRLWVMLLTTTHDIHFFISFSPAYSITIAAFLSFQFFLKFGKLAKKFLMKPSSSIWIIYKKSSRILLLFFFNVSSIIKKINKKKKIYYEANIYLIIFAVLHMLTGWYVWYSTHTKYIYIHVFPSGQVEG